MANSKAEVANMALGLLGDSRVIQDLATETSVQATACLLYFDHALKECLEDFPWAFAKKTESLGDPVEEFDEGPWAYSYRPPTDMVTPRRITIANGQTEATETINTKIKYEMGRDTTGPLIFTSEADAYLEYTFFEEDVARWTTNFTMAFAYKLAQYIAPRLSKSAELTQLCRTLFIMSWTKARGESGNRGYPGPRPESEIIGSR